MDSMSACLVLSPCKCLDTPGTDVMLEICKKVVFQFRQGLRVKTLSFFSFNAFLKLSYCIIVNALF